MNIESVLRQTAKQFPQKPMLIFNNRSVTFMEMDELSSRMAAGLRGLGLTKGDRVTLGMPNCPEMIIAFMAIVRAGCIAVPLNPVMKEKELRHIFSDCKAAAAITYHGHIGIIRMIEETGSPVPGILISVETEDDARVLTYESTIANISGPRHQSSESPSDENIAAIVYTSGTTGQPKGVTLSHLNMISVAGSVANFQKRNDTDCGVCFFPLTHITGIVNFIVDSLCTGATIILQDRFDLDDYLQKFHEYNCTTLGGVTAVFRAILDCPDLDRYDFSNLRRITSGGASLPKEMYRKLSRRFNVPIIEMYGMTENSATLTSNPLNRQKIGSVGVPLPGMAIQIKGEDDQRLPAGSVGEVMAKGPGIMKGYYNNPDLTQKAIRDGWYHTGDMGYIDEDGFLYIVDRKDDMINAGAFKIFPREVEEVLFSHPDVDDCAVLGVPDERLGQIPIAYIVLHPGKTLLESDMIQYVKSKIANYKAPRYVIFRDSLPRSQQGKINKKELETPV